MSDLWEKAADDRQSRCAIAHYLADVQDETVAELAWDLRALEYAEDENWLPSLHVNLADDYRRLGDTAKAEEHLEAARTRLRLLADDAYGELMRSAVEHVAQALAERSTRRLETSPGG
ncbi:hypothetical protein E1218_02295 [Kribbella turkmenica]|uniref:Tetratricopeptide repeat protein n=1 Tax=Kribbella turkmenica TaxID=2530375 RepID=A0A4R4XH69_9ACTN|nr:hypothetical protein E1218_02295 [Kribbella turkmenica]